jgi:hypothetical protein
VSPLASVGLAAFILALVWLHDRRAVARERRQQERHDDLIRALADHSRLMLGKAHQDHDLQRRTMAIAGAVNGHADILAELGHPGAARVAEAA